jgi:hypothetical protein
MLYHNIYERVWNSCKPLFNPETRQPRVERIDGREKKNPMPQARRRFGSNSIAVLIASSIEEAWRAALRGHCDPLWPFIRRRPEQDHSLPVSREDFRIYSIGPAGVHVTGAQGGRYDLIVAHIRSDLLP